MKRIKKIWSWLKLQVAMRYEGSVQWFNGQRSWLNASIQDMRFDANASTRLELLRRSRYWEQNNGIVQRLIDVFVQFTVGPNGLQMIPDSSDEAFNESAKDCFERWCAAPDLTSSDTFGTMQQTMARSLFFDGEIFVHKTKDANGKPKIELIEAHRVATPPDLMEKEGKGIVDGVKVDSKGIPQGYYVRSGFDDKTFGFVKAEEIVHRFKKVRPGQYRGLPMLYPVINDLHDLDDLQMLENQAAKDAASVSNVITTASGEANTAQMIRKRLQAGTTEGATQNVTKDMPQFTEITPGARTFTLKPNEKMEQFRSDRPSVAAREYWDYLTAKICAGVGISRLLVFPYSVQGTVTRADLDISAGLFRTRSKIIEAVCKELYVWVIDRARKYDNSLDGEPKDGTWNQVTSHPPRSPNVDVGRNSQAMLAELEAGTRTYQDVYAELGQDWRAQLTQKAKERAFIHKLAKDVSIGLEKDDAVSIDEIAAMAIPQDAPEPAEKNTKDSPATTATP